MDESKKVKDFVGYRGIGLLIEDSGRPENHAATWSGCCSIGQFIGVNRGHDSTGPYTLAIPYVVICKLETPVRRANPSPTSRSGYPSWSSIASETRSTNAVTSSASPFRSWGIEESQ